ncbi:MAG: long-chain fatty acid--CoA ligase [Candidatus Marinimicrobia bacterium]|nr:long-chain fatty acid--CoA ligase [Candidatus Neomarinimicrobiota bacterium]MBT3999587.1 long-chain fatty acid--CoA ligase [Candidatus Neomarinimicrobiota bacterium]MBT4282906.1 long-chain fatty acid--CoA ligase [Candidatus Neomarinimicrobiota bacterium]MBT6632052.1 long-chain fatty acid--CoA ligase [Candidatus Neomarinimicrobiota bacterium]
MNTPKMLINNANQYSDEPAISVKDSQGNWETDTWSEFFDFSMKISKSLLSLGLQIDDKISIYSYNRKEWYGCYIASQMLNAVSVGVYHTCSSEEVEWVVGNSDSKIVFVGNNPGDNDETAKMPNHRFLNIIDRLEKVETVVMMKGVDTLNHEKAITWDAFIERGQNINESEVLTRIDGISEESTSSLIYTSGTTGNPKGVELTHKNWMFELESVGNTFQFSQGERYVSWLPLAHVFGQLVDNHYWINTALHLHIVNSPLYVVDYAKEVKPHLFIGVPRIYEKIFSNLKAAIDGKAILKFGLKIPGLSGVFKGKLKEAIGFSSMRFAISGAAPINPDILTFFQSLDIPLFEGYGMTENVAGATLNYTGNNKIGSVGKAMPGTEMKIADDGEILISGDHVMKGYYKNPEATAETIIDSWLHTGDVGKIDSDGFISITGRKKEIYVSSGGKNIAPLVIEETMKVIPLLSQCFLVGDAKKYCSALFTLDVSAILRDKLGVNANEIPKDPGEQIIMLKDLDHSLSDFTESDEIIAEIQSFVNNLNSKFSNPEQIKKFTILPRDFTIDDGELTPTLKIRRKQIRENWVDVIDSMYTS